MHYYADFEALEFKTSKAFLSGIYPYYLDREANNDTALCPLMLSACDRNGEVIEKQAVPNDKISFLKLCDKIIRKTRKDFPVFFVWFHNIKYDFQIILHELFYNDFENILDSENFDYKGEYKSEGEKAFSIIGKNLSNYKGINLYYRGHKIMIRDTMSILNSAQDKILKEFGYDSKVKITWENITLENLSYYMPIIEERNIYDIVSLAKCIEQFKEVFENNFNGRGSTAATMSFDSLSYFLAKNLYEKPTHEEKQENFRNRYPQLQGRAKELSQGAYHGGICTLNPKYANKILFNLQMVDINSSYPFSMTKQLPYGRGYEIDDFTDEGYSEYIVYIKFCHTGIPFQRCHSENRARFIIDVEPTNVRYTRSQFPQSFEGYLCINSIDLATLARYASISQLEFIRGYNYDTTDDIKNFITPIYNMRKKEEGVKKLAIKLLLNSLYGKFAQDLSGQIFLYSSMQDYTKISATDLEHYYKPFASAVTAYSRQNLIDMIYRVGENFIYADTDSVYYTSPDTVQSKISEYIDEEELGKWGHEYKEIKAGKFLSKKNYLLVTGKGYILKCVGLSSRYHKMVNFRNFHLQSQEFEIKKMVNIYGGKAMRDTVFTIKERAL